MAFKSGWVTKRMNGWPGRVNGQEGEYGKVNDKEMEGIDGPEDDCVDKSTSVPDNLCFRFSLTSLTEST